MCAEFGYRCGVVVVLSGMSRRRGRRIGRTPNGAEKLERQGGRAKRGENPGAQEQGREGAL